MYIAHIIIKLLSGALILCLFIQALLSWLPMIPQTHPVNRFFNNVTGPVLDPIRRRLPALSMGMFDLSYTIAFLLAWWAIGIVASLLLQALPATW